MENFQTVRGVKDLLPKELGKMRFIEQQAALVCKNACYEEISVPIFEFAKLFSMTLTSFLDLLIIIDNKLLIFIYLARK